MARSSRMPEERETTVDLSLIVARQSDILFNPLSEGGQTLLTYRTHRLSDEITKWAALKSIGPERLDEEEDLKYLRSLEPTEWKDQDHYAVMGLKNLRFRATDDDIKRAYRLRCLRHHPDKRQAAGEAVIPDSDYFACIVKAYEILGVPAKRRSYDSIDPRFDDYIPPKNISNPREFFQVYGEWFELNSRWSNKSPVPLLGNIQTPRQKVEKFYSFWYEFDSWREYSYLDEEDKEKGQYREERRWIDKQNKQARAKLKKEEMCRIRTVVDNSYACDPRIAIFKDEDSQQKLAKKLARQTAVKQKQLEEQKLREEAETEARLEKERLEAEEKEKELASKKEKEAYKKAIKKERKNLRTLCKTHKYYAQNEDDIVTNMTSVEQLCDILPLQELEELSTKLSSLNLEDAREVFFDRVNLVLRKIQNETKETIQAATTRHVNGVHGNDQEDEWTHDELALLTKSVNLFPAGTIHRWEVVANFVSQHSNDKKQRSAKEVLAKAKDLKQAFKAQDSKQSTGEFSMNILKEEANVKAFDFFEKSVKNVPVESELSTRDDSEPIGDVKKRANNAVPEKVKSSGSVEGRSSSTWTPEDQKLLEQALKTYPASLADRWDRISDCVPNRTKKECMARFKEIAALVKAKKLSMVEGQKTAQNSAKKP